MPADWTQPPLAGAPGDLGSVLVGARLLAVENDRARREARLRFALPPNAGPSEATFLIEATTHLLVFAYLPPAEPRAERLEPEEAIAWVSDWARQGLVTNLDVGLAETPLIVTHARLHVLENAMTLAVEGYGENLDLLVWWEVRVSGRTVVPETVG